MLVLSIAMTVLSGLVCLAWISRHFQISREKRQGQALNDRCPGPPAVAPRLSVLVAAKDEEANIETCLRSLLAQDYPNFELTACDDRSTDRTGPILDALAAEEDRLRVIHVKELPPGWCGKNNAMRVGIAAGGGEWICMSDADCRFLSPRMLSAAVQYAVNNSVDMLSVLPTLEMRGFWENVVQPICGGVMMIWFRPDKVNDPSRPNAYANGAFMLIRRGAYEAAGGHEAVKSEVNEDMHMAARVKRAGLRLRVVRSEGLILSRMYTSLGTIIRGWSRIFYGTFGTLRRLTTSLAVLCTMSLYPYLAAAVGLSLGSAGVQPAGTWWTCGIVASATVAVKLSVIWRFYRFAGARAGLFWAYLAGVIVTIIALAGSFRKLRPGSQVVWRSTTYTKT